MQLLGCLMVASPLTLASQVGPLLVLNKGPTPEPNFAFELSSMLRRGRWEVRGSASKRQVRFVKNTPHVRPKSSRRTKKHCATVRMHRVARVSPAIMAKACGTTQT